MVDDRRIGTGNNLHPGSAANETDGVMSLDARHSWVVDAASTAEASHLHRVAP
jgi:hypothetical protein